MVLSDLNSTFPVAAKEDAVNVLGQISNLSKKRLRAKKDKLSSIYCYLNREILCWETNNITNRADSILIS